MAKSRLLFHPILVHQRSRRIFMWFLFVASILGYVLWSTLMNILEEAGIHVGSWLAQSSLTLQVLLSPYFFLTLVFLSSAVAASITSHYIVGPVRRIEQWLRDWEAGHSMPALQVRSGDKYSGLAHIINAICQWAENEK